MSWWATLEVEGNAAEDFYSVNFTHNTNEMIATVMREKMALEPDRAWWDGDRPGTFWCHVLNGQGATKGCEFLVTIIAGLRAEPNRFQSMNPPNNWGNYDGLLNVLEEMLNMGKKYPEGVWRVSG